jgi:hypothetical protein
VTSIIVMPKSSQGSQHRSSHHGTVTRRSPQIVFVSDGVEHHSGKSPPAVDHHLLERWGDLGPLVERRLDGPAATALDACVDPGLSVSPRNVAAEERGRDARQARDVTDRVA